MRVPHIDIFKGLLIILVVWGHICYVITLSTGIELSSIVWKIVSNIADNWIAPYYMGAFFLVTGICSSFKRTFKEQLTIDFKRLIVPAICIPFIMCLFQKNPIEFFLKVSDNLFQGKIPWFLASMFLARATYKMIICTINNEICRSCLFVLISVVGCWMLNNYSEYNVLWIFHAFSFVIYIYIGNTMRNDFKVSGKALLLSICLYVGIELIISKLSISSPALCEIITFRTWMWPVYITLTLSGSYVLFFLSKKIKQNSVLQYIGRNSLVIYLTHITFIRLLSYIIKDYIEKYSSAPYGSIIIVASMLTGSVLWGLLWAHIFKIRYLRWIVGEY